MIYICPYGEMASDKLSLHALVSRRRVMHDSGWCHWRDRRPVTGLLGRRVPALLRMIVDQPQVQQFNIQFRCVGYVIG